MPITKTITLYTYDELDDEAKQRAREWYAGLAFSDSSDWAAMYDDANQVAELLGIEIDQREYKTVGGGTGTEPCIWFSGFSSQGDGACFEGTYRYRKGCVKLVKDYAPQDKVLHDIAESLMRAQQNNFYRLRAKVKHSGFYYHSGCTQIEVYDEHDIYKDVGPAEKLVAMALRRFMDWIYDQLEKEHDYQTSDEAVEEALRANEYTFTATGKRED